MSDFGNAHPLAGCLRAEELAAAGCGRDCRCTSMTCRMARELRSLRSHPPGLTAEDREALEHARSFVINDLGGCDEEGCCASQCQRNRRAIALLDKLLGGGE